MLLDFLYDAINAALPAIGGENIFRAKQSFSIPSDPFITYDLVFLDLSAFESYTDGDKYEDPESELPEPEIGTFDRTYQRNCPTQIQIDCYSPIGFSELSNLVSYFRMEDCKEIFDAAHVGFVSAEQIRNMGFLGDNDYRDRYMLTVNFNIAMTRTEAKNAILDWGIGGQIDEIETTIVVDERD